MPGFIPKYVSEPPDNFNFEYTDWNRDKPYKRRPYIVLGSMGWRDVSSIPAPGSIPDFCYIFLLNSFFNPNHLGSYYSYIDKDLHLNICKRNPTISSFLVKT